MHRKGIPMFLEIFLDLGNVVGKLRKLCFRWNWGRGYFRREEICVQKVLENDVGSVRHLSQFCFND